MNYYYEVNVLFDLIFILKLLVMNCVKEDIFCESGPTTALRNQGFISFHRLLSYSFVIQNQYWLLLVDPISV